jgi:hypothetical protein
MLVAHLIGEENGGIESGGTPVFIRFAPSSSLRSWLNGTFALTEGLPSTFARQFLATLEDLFLWRSVPVFGESLNAKIVAKLSFVDARHLVSPGTKCPA